MSRRRFCVPIERCILNSTPSSVTNEARLPGFVTSARHPGVDRLFRGAAAVDTSGFEPAPAFDHDPIHRTENEADQVADVEVVGYLRSAFGMGAAARALVVALGRAGLQVAATVDDRTAHHSLDDDHGTTADDFSTPVAQPRERPSAGSQHPPALVLVRNADALLADPSDAIAARVAGRRVVGLWFWEVESFPERLVPAFDLLDEIWVATEFVAASLRAHTNAPPVRVVPFPLPDHPTNPLSAIGSPVRLSYVRLILPPTDSSCHSVRLRLDRRPEESVGRRSSVLRGVSRRRLAVARWSSPTPDHQGDRRRAAPHRSRPSASCDR